MTLDLSRLLRPKSIALLGGVWAENVIVQLQKSGFNGDIWPVHPRRDEICGVKCYRSIEDLPASPDASFVGVNRELTINVIKTLSAMGAGGAICFASGFAESESENTGGADLENQLIEAAGEMPILGPNCYGLINYLDNATLWPDKHGGRACDRGVAIIGQSSNILINMTMQQRALPIAYVVAAGNQAQIGISDVGSALLDDARVTAIGLYIEGFGDIRAFESFAAKARSKGKQIIAIKSGKSQKSRAATITHTASLAGGAAASSAFLKRLGIIEVSSVAVFLETLKLLHMFGALPGNAISSMSCSGGEAGLIADMVEGSNFDFRNISSKQCSVLKDVLGPLVTIANPLDYHTFIWGDPIALEQTYTAVLSDGFDLNILIMDIPLLKRCDDSAWHGPINAVIKAKRNTAARVGLLGTIPENLSEELSDRLMMEGIVPMHGMEEMVQAVDAVIRAGQIEKGPVSPAMLAPGMDETAIVLDEAHSKTELAAFGLNFPEAVSAVTPTDIGNASADLSFPLVLKGLGIAHKSEAGAVVLNLGSSHAVETAAGAMKNVNGFLVEEMVTEPVCELLIGITKDETGLMLLTIGAGGVMTELLQDTASLIIPAERNEISKALQGLNLAKLLNGFRGKPKADIDAILDAIEAVQAYCLANTNLIELDINPLMARADNAIAVDALIRKGS
ncbi:MAG: acetate--CoA ligase family protein [Pseudomonadota bacterium]